jgi:hypothetical protein
VTEVAISSRLRRQASALLMYQYYALFSTEALARVQLRYWQASIMMRLDQPYLHIAASPWMDGWTAHCWPQLLQ